MSSGVRQGLSKVIVVDAEGAILGRLCTYIAKALQEGYRVYVVNAERAVLSGERRRVIESYKVWLRIKTLRNPQKRSPKRPRTPISLLKRAVEGMLPKNFSKGYNALTNLKVYVGVPEELRRERIVKVESVSKSRLGREYITLGEVAKALGWKG